MSFSKTEHLQPIPYLGFDGNCTEAIKFYETVLNAKIRVISTAADTPMASQIPKEFLHRVMNAQLELPGGYLLYENDLSALASLDERAAEVGGTDFLPAMLGEVFAGPTFLDPAARTVSLILVITGQEHIAGGGDFVFRDAI